MKKITLIIFIFCIVNFFVFAQSRTNNSTSENKTKIYITVNGKTQNATLVENSATKELLTRLKKGNITVETHDYGNFEKVGSLGFALPTENTSLSTKAGDIVLYQGKNICFYYDTNSWSFTRLGKLDISGESEIREFLQAGKGNTKIILSLE